MLFSLFDNKTKSKFISARVPSGMTEEETFKLPKDATIKSIEARIYPGAQLDLQLEPVLEKKDSDTEIDLVDYPGDKNHIEGDDDVIQLPTNVEAEKDDVLKVKAENTDQNGNSYDYYVIIVLEER